MKIYSMTATFGKLENQTMTFQPGLNVISAPNEWGKSTWCAFLVNMLYGLETRVKTTKTAIADKDRYAPWSGSPMSGRIDLNWNGRDITVERWTKGRTPMGEFRAYETVSGIAVPELTATTCGEMLLGVERSVFLRAGFLRLTDLPVTEDDALRRRLNALVSTGDESGAADDLAQKLRDLKNKCRSNRTNGLIPQAEAEKAAIEEKLRQISMLQNQSQANIVRRQELLDELAKLQNHQIALEYAAGEENNRRIADARDAARLAQINLQEQEKKCENLPDRETARQKLHALQDLQQKQQQARVDAQMLPPAPQEPPAPPCFYGLTGEKALEHTNGDIADFHAAAVPGGKAFPLWLPGGLAAVVGAILLILKLWIPGTLLIAAGAACVALYLMQARKREQANFAAATRQQTIASRYGGGMPEDWLAQAQRYARQRQEYENALQQHAALRQQALDAIAHFDSALEAATEKMGYSAAVAHYSDALRLWDALEENCRRFVEAQKHAESMAAMAKPLEKPAMADDLTYSAAETQQRIDDARRELQQLQQRQGQYQGLMEAMGQEAQLRRQLEQINTRLAHLGDTYAALELAQATLASATAELQRRFAPRIASEAQHILSRLTDGRYDRLSISQDMSLSAATGEDTVLREAQRRSEGTVDQIYLALRLAVSRELTPDAPFILDDALVRFDDARHAAAMEILKEEGENRQIILFTCQAREKA